MAAEKLADEMIETADRLAAFPYSNAVYFPIRPLKKEYRKRMVQNYLMFYWVDEEEKCVTLAGVVYVRRNYDRLLF